MTHQPPSTGEGTTSESRPATSTSPTERSSVSRSSLFSLAFMGLTPEQQRALAPFRELRSIWWKQFRTAYIEYGPGAADDTGLRGQWGDLHRKVKKLRRFMWDGDEEHLKRETPREILLDIIGHAFLALEMLDRGVSSSGSESESQEPPFSFSQASSRSSALSSASEERYASVCGEPSCYWYRNAINRDHQHSLFFEVGRE